MTFFQFLYIQLIVSVLCEDEAKGKEQSIFELHALSICFYFLWFQDILENNLNKPAHRAVLQTLKNA